MQSNDSPAEDVIKKSGLVNFIDNVIEENKQIPPEISNENAKQHAELTDFIRQINSKDKKRPMSEKDAKSVMTYKTYMSNLEDSPGDLENILTPGQLDSILIFFGTHSTKNIDLSTFQEALIHLLQESKDFPNDSNSIKQKAVQLFKKIDWLDSGFITPESFCEFFLSRLQNDKAQTHLPPLDQNEKLIQLSFLKEPIMKILVDTNGSSKYIIVTKDCQFFNISSNFVLKSTADLNSNASSEKASLKKRWLKTSVTDAICLPVNKLVVATANRDLLFYDMATSLYVLQFHLMGLPSCVLCMYQHSRKTSANKELLLFFGTDYGTVHLLTFLMPEKNMFETPFKKAESSWKVFFCDIQNHSRYVTHKTFNIGQKDWIQQIMYLSESEQVVSACLASSDSLVFHPVIEEKGRTYKFNVSKGVHCFDYNKSLGLLAIGSKDHMLRFWDPYVTSKPIAILKNHQAPIVGLFIHAPTQLVFSYSKDRHVCVFDIKDQVCIQNVSIKSPPLSNPQEHGPSPLVYSGQSLLISGDIFAAELKFIQPSLHKSSLSGDDHLHPSTVIATILMLPKLQLLTACQSGEIKLWNINTGQLIDTLSDSNCFDELSAVDVDCTNEWMVCGYMNGTATVWNLSKGLKEKTLEKYASKEIMSVIVLPGMSIIFVFGWSRKILAYYDSPLSISLKPDSEWLSLQAHEDDILCAVFIRPMYIATSSFDGDIFLWNIEYKRLFKKIQIGRNQFKWRKKIFENDLIQLARSGLRSSKSRRSANRAVSSILFKEPVECLLYLNERSAERCAALVSAEGATVKFWSTISVGSPAASFEVCEDDNVITALASDMHNTLLLVGDSAGYIWIFSIEGYASCKRFSEVILQVMQNGHESRCRSTRVSPPKLLNKWSAHENSLVTCLKVFECNNEKYVVSGGTDCCVILWSMKGTKIGVFTKAAKWNLDRKIRSKANTNAKVSKDSKTAGIVFKDDHLPIDCGDNLDCEGITNNISNVSMKEYESQLANQKLLSDTIQSASTTSEARNEIYRRIGEMKESWSFLGEHYNKDFSKRMSNRFKRRQVESLDRPMNERGGLPACAPFNAVILKDLQEVPSVSKDFFLTSKETRGVPSS